jgi:hypothetical protein
LEEKEHRERTRLIKANLRKEEWRRRSGESQMAEKKRNIEKGQG